MATKEHLYLLQGPISTTNSLNSMYVLSISDFMPQHNLHEIVRVLTYGELCSHMVNCALLLHRSIIYCMMLKSLKFDGI